MASEGTFSGELAQPAAGTLPQLHEPTHGSGPCIVLALRGHAQPSASLLRAGALSRAWGAPLHVLQVLPVQLFYRTVLRAAWGRAEPARVEERARLAQQATGEWLQAAQLGGEAQTLVLQGDFDAVVAAYAARVGARLVVLPPRLWGTGSRATSLAKSCQVPVLVAREQGPANAIVAATDLSSLQYPVLRRAAELGACLSAPVVAVHNVQPAAVYAGASGPAVVLGADPSRAARSAQLSRATAQLAADMHAVLRDEGSAAEAILAEAGERDADLIVVGARHRSRLQRLMAASVAEQVVQRAARSVLVTPL